MKDLFVGPTSLSPLRQDVRVAPNWPVALRVYLAVTAVGNLAWEMLHLPLYTIWTEGTWQQKAFAVFHCTGGDVLIGLTVLTFALITVGGRDWPRRGHKRVLGATIVLGVGYTIFSEWLNIVVRASWAYSELMPVVPFLNTGLSPILQWIVVPFLALNAARRAVIPSDENLARKLESARN